MAAPEEREREGALPAVADDHVLTNIPAAPHVVGQSLEALIVYLDAAGRIHHLRPIHAEALRLGWQADLQPGEVVADAVARYGLSPLLVHSTSWRMEENRVVLTYIVVVEAPGELSEYLTDDLVGRADLARGDAMGPPAAIEAAQVLEHGLRHLSWLVKDDPAVEEAIPSWAEALRAYEPEPFRAFTGPLGR